MARFSNTDLSLKTVHKTVAATGTPEQVAANYNIPEGVEVVIEAKATNTGKVYLGSTSATAVKTATTAHKSLDALDQMVVQVDDLNKLWLDADVNGEGVEVTFEKGSSQA